MIFRTLSRIFGTTPSTPYIQEALTVKLALEHSLGVIYFKQHQTPNIAHIYNSDAALIRKTYGKLMKTCLCGDENKLEAKAREVCDSLVSANFYDTQKAYDYGRMGMELPR